MATAVMPFSHVQFGRYFAVRERGSTFTTELRAGVVTFLTVSEVTAAAVEAQGLLGPPTPWKERLPCLHLVSCTAAPNSILFLGLVVSSSDGVLLLMQVAYILAVNSAILADTGGTCSDADCTVCGLQLQQLPCNYSRAP